MPSRIEFDDHAWPKVYVTWPSEPLSDEAFIRAIDQISSYTARAQPYVIVHDARHTTRPSPKQRAVAAERQKRDAAASRRWLRGVAMVVSNPLIVGVVTAINWISPPPYPQKIFSRFADAEAWIEEKMRQEHAGLGA